MDRAISGGRCLVTGSCSVHLFVGHYTCSNAWRENSPSFEGTRSWGVDEGEGDDPRRRYGCRLRA